MHHEKFGTIHLTNSDARLALFGFEDWIKGERPVLARLRAFAHLMQCVQQIGDDNYININELLKVPPRQA